MTGDELPEQTPAVQASGPQPTFIERHGITPAWFAAASLALLFIAYQGIGGVVTFFLFGLTPGPSDAVPLRVVTAAGELLLLAIPVFFLARLASHSTVSFLRLKLPRAGVLLLPAVSIVALQQMSQVYLVLQDRIPVPPELVPVLEEMRKLFEELTRLLAGAHSAGELVGVLAAIALVPAVAEELLFRGLVLRSFGRTLPPLRAIVLTGVIFGAYHFSPMTFVPLAVLGCYLGFLAWRSDSIWVSVAAHFYNNAYACVMLYIGRDDSLVGGGDPSTMPPGPLLLNFWFFGIVFLLSTILFLRITRSPAPGGADVEGGDNAPDDPSHHEPRELPRE